MATKNVTVIFDRKGKVLKNGSGEVEFIFHATKESTLRSALPLLKVGNSTKRVKN